MDATDIKILEILQKDGRISMKELGKKVSLTSPAVSERIKKLEEKEIITGYKAIVDPKKFNKHLTAFINVSLNFPAQKPFLDLVNENNLIIECHHMTGSDCMTIKVIASNTHELESLIGKIQHLGDTETTIILSTPLDSKPILP